MTMMKQPQLGLRIEDIDLPSPPSTNPTNVSRDLSRDHDWDGDWQAQMNANFGYEVDPEGDTQPGIGPIQEKKVFPPYKYEPPVVERSDKLFVFGTLRKGCSLNMIVARDKFIRAAMTPPTYRMINISDEFPAVLAGGRVAIVGELYEVLPRTIEFLDRIEDCPATHHRDIISLEDGTRAHIYLMHRYKTPAREEDIPSGDWIEWKKTERLRVKDKKEKFKLLMAKGKRDAEERRKALEESINNRREDPSYVGHGARIFDPVTGKYKLLPSHVQERPTQERTTYTDRSGRKTVHISDVSMIDLRKELTKAGVDTEEMKDTIVRVECMARYGMWYEVDA